MHIVEDLIKRPDIEKFIKTSGTFDLCVSVLLKNIEQFIAIQNAIVAIPGVRKIQTDLQKITSSLPFPRSNMPTFEQMGLGLKSNYFNLY